MIGPICSIPTWVELASSGKYIYSNNVVKYKFKVLVLYLWQREISYFLLQNIYVTALVTNYVPN